MMESVAKEPVVDPAAESATEQASVAESGEKEFAVAEKAQSDHHGSDVVMADAQEDVVDVGMMDAQEESKSSKPS